MKLTDIFDKLIIEQNFYPKGCRPTLRDDLHGQATDGKSIKKIRKDFKYSTSAYWAKKSLDDLQKKSKFNLEYRNAKDDLWQSMDGASREIYEKLGTENHPLYYYLVSAFAQNAKSAVESVVPSGYNSLSTKRVTDYKVSIGNWVTKLEDIGNNDYSYSFEFDRLIKTKGVN